MECKKIKELPIQIIDGDRGKNYPNGDDFKKEKYCLFLNAKNVTDNGFDFTETMFINKEKDELLRKGKLEKSDIVLTTRGTVGNVAYYSDNIEYQNIRINSGMVILRCDNDIIYSKYLYYVLKSRSMREQINQIKTGSAQPQLPIAVLKELELKLIDLNEQKKIVKILEDIDKKIELNNQINDNLLKLNRSLFEKHFEEDISCVEKDLLGNICNIKYGKGLPTSKILKEGFPVYGGNGIIGFYNEYIYKDSQILISCRGAASGKVIFSKPKSFVTNNSLILECDRYLYYYLKELSLKYPYYQYITGSAQPQITIDNIKGIEINIPQKERLELFNILSEKIEKEYFNNTAENENLERIRDTLLPKLMNGEIDLDKIEI